jgi:hypothetical protein
LRVRPFAGTATFFLTWHSHAHFIILMSNEQSWFGPHDSPTGHSPGQSPCLLRLQKKVSIRKQLGKSRFNVFG